VSHPVASAPADREAIEPGEVWENPVTGERAVILELPLPASPLSSDSLTLRA